MPRHHSQLYTTQGLIDNIGPEKRLNGQILKDLINSSLSYSDMADLLREVNDAQFNIISTVVRTPEGEQWLRDATHALPLALRMSHNEPIIEANNMLLRSLSRLRPIDFAIGKKLGEDAVQIQQAMREKLANLSAMILEIAQDPHLSKKEKLEEIKAEEKKFNTFLIKQLHEANLTEGCKTAKDAQKLLSQYRNLSSVIEPSRPMVTLTYDETANIVHRETQYPVTKKTAIQQDDLNQLQVVTPYPRKHQKNAHSSLTVAEQQADQLFADLIRAPDRALAAQTRKTHLVGAKNAFIVKNEIFLVDNVDHPEVLDTLKADGSNVFWVARMGSPAYVGKGEDPKQVQKHTGEVLEQVRNTAAEKMELGDDQRLNLHVSTLNTYSFLENQATIVSNIAEVTRKAGQGDDYSYLPTNDDGTFRLVNIAAGLDFREQKQPSGWAPLAKSTRVDSVSKVIRAASRKEHTLSVVNCASGQDRTGTAVQKATDDWLKERYQALEKSPIHIEEIHARGGNAAEITSHHVHGSPGMKKDSIANDRMGKGRTFSPLVTNELYRESANTNKKSHVQGAVAFLQHPSERAVTDFRATQQHFEDQVRLFKENYRDNEDALNLAQQAEKLSLYINEKAGTDPTSLASGDLADLNHVIEAVSRSITEIDDPEKTKENAQELLQLSQHVSGKGNTWKNIGMGLLGLVGAALVCIGITVVLADGGLFIAMASAIGLSASNAIPVTAGTIAGATALGIGLFSAGQEKGLAKEVSRYKENLQTFIKEIDLENPNDASELPPSPK